MEGIIMMVVIFIISSLFSGNKKKQQKSMPPFGKTNTTNFEPPKRNNEQKKNPSLEDFAKDIFQQLNEKNIFPKELLEPQVMKEEVNERIELNSSPVQKQETVNNSRPKLDVNRSTRTVENSIRIPSRNIDDKIKSQEIGDFIPSSRDALVQAIITSEIIGPPKAKR